MPDRSMPFYLMGSPPNSDKCPDDPERVIAGLERAIKSTEKRIEEYSKSGADVSDLEFHLKKLRDSLWKVQKG